MCRDASARRHSQSSGEQADHGARAVGSGEGGRERLRRDSPGSAAKGAFGVRRANVCRGGMLALRRTLAPLLSLFEPKRADGRRRRSEARESGSACGASTGRSTRADSTASQKPRFTAGSACVKSRKRVPETELIIRNNGCTERVLQHQTFDSCLIRRLVVRNLTCWSLVLLACVEVPPCGAEEDGNGEDDGRVIHVGRVHRVEVRDCGQIRHQVSEPRGASICPGRFSRRNAKTGRTHCRTGRR